MFQEYPKWVYFTDGPQESYADGLAPVVVNSAEEEAALSDAVTPARRGRPRKVAEVAQ
jgi:hypothetical protein